MKLESSAPTHFRPPGKGLPIAQKPGQDARSVSPQKVTDLPPAKPGEESNPAIPAQSEAGFENNRQQFLRHANRLLSAQPAPARQVVDTDSPGSVLTSFGQSVVVEAAVPVPGFSAPALEIAMIRGDTRQSAANNAKANTEVKANDEAFPANGHPAAGAANEDEDEKEHEQERNAGKALEAREALRSGFTHEEELFRTRWGWAAFDDIQRAAFEAAQPSE